MEALGIDIKLMIAQAINLAVFIFIFMKFFNAPFQKFLNKSVQQEKERNEMMADLADREEKLAGKEEDVLGAARKKAGEVLEKAEKDADAQRKALVAQAENEAKDLKSKAMSDIDTEKDKMYADVRSHIIETSEKLAEKALGQVLTEKKQKEIVADITNVLKQSKVA